MNTTTLASFDSLVERHSREIFNYLWRMLRDPQDAEDCLQETFLRAFGEFARLRVDSNPRAWLYKIATNVALTHRKKRSAWETRHQALIGDILAAQESVEDADLFRAVFAAVEALPPKQRAALLLRNFQGLEYLEIAAALEISADSARANVYQALRKLRKHFMEENTE